MYRNLPPKYARPTLDGPLFRPFNCPPALILLLVALCLITGCSTPAPEIISSLIQPTATATPTVGTSRNNAFNGWQPIHLKHWQVQVLEVVRGAEAWQRLKQANPHNKPPEDGWEYLLIHYQVQRKGNRTVKEGLNLNLTGSNNILYYNFYNAAVPPEPIFESYLPGGATSQGWDVYLVQEGEYNLTVVIHDWSDYTEPIYYAWLDEGAVHTVPPVLEAIEPTKIGGTIDDPLPFGQMATTADWQLRLETVESGQKAWERVVAANQFNKPPPDGQLYLLAKVWLRYIGNNAASETIMTDSHFRMIGSDQATIAPIGVSSLPHDPSLLSLYPGGEMAFWVAFWVAEDEERPILLFAPGYRDYENQRYLSLQADGR